MEMIFLYKILPYLSVDNKTISLVKEMFGYNFLKPECVKNITSRHPGVAARNEAEEQIIHNKNSTGNAEEKHYVTPKPSVAV